MSSWINATWSGQLLPEPGEVVDEAFTERVVDVVMNELIDLGYDNVVVGASLRDGTLEIAAPLDSNEDYQRLDSSIRAAFHSAGIITAGWFGDNDTHPVGRTLLRVELVDEFV